jgi:uncharacterized HAD superfamily protein
MKIGIDIDNVIANTFFELSHEFNRFMGRDIDAARVSEEIRRNNFKLWLYWFITWRKKMLAAVSPIEGAIDTVQELFDEHHIRLVTSSLPIFNRQTKDWLKKYKIPYHELHHTKERMKFEKATDCDIFIEDNLDECEILAEHCEYIYLFDYPWNQRQPKKGNIIRVQNWNELRDKLKKKI